MRHPLRDEILVVMRYGTQKIFNGLGLMQKVEMFRDNMGDRRKVSLNEMGFELRTMVKEGLLDPWQHRRGQKSVRRIENIEPYHPIQDVFYSLTYAGYHAHLKAIERFVDSALDFRLYLRRKPSQS